MNFRMTTFLGTTAAAALVATGAFAQTTTAPAPAAAPAAPPAPTAAPYPAMSASLAGAAPPMTYDLGILGSKVSIGGVISGLAYVQSNRPGQVVEGDGSVVGGANTGVDVSNAQIFINKSDGIFQYFIQAGTYSIPTLSSGPYLSSSKQTTLSFGNVPTAFLKIVPPTGPFSLQIGELPTIIGDEYVFTFENLNITRGLLWGAEPAISRGVQLNYSAGPFSASVAWTDGFYSNRFNTISALGTWVIDGSNTLAVDASIPISKSTTYEETYAASPAYDNSKVYNIMYTHTMGQWIINPYLQYTALPEVTGEGGSIAVGKEETWGAALLINYAFDSKATFDGMSLSGLSIPFRVEYMHTNGSANGTPPAPDLLFGPSSKAWSITLTPTYQYKNYFIRGEANYVIASDVTPGDGYGTNFTANNQFRGVIETGVLF